LMANSLGTAANVLDGDVAQLQTDLATYLAAGGSARDFWWWLQLKLTQTSGYTNELTNIIVKGASKGTRPSPASLNKTLATLTPGAIYP
jgi:hypothetical protein